MQTEDKAFFSGMARFTIGHADGTETATEWQHNTITTVGKVLVAENLSTDIVAWVGYIAIGTGTGQGVGSTTLATEIARDTCTLTQGTAGDANKVTFRTVFEPGQGTGTITEMGLFNDVTVGTMFAVADPASVVKAADESLTVEYVLTCGA